jgi:hypothetical protein
MTLSAVFPPFDPERFEEKRRRDAKRWNLPFAAVKLQCLDVTGAEVPGASASGFVCSEADGLYLYTCWHVVSGYGSPFRLSVKGELSPRAFLKLEAQAVEDRAPGMQVIGGKQDLVLPIMDLASNARRCLWLQEGHHRPHEDLNNVGVRVPTFFDAVKIKLGAEVEMPPVSIHTPDKRSLWLHIGQTILIAGFPHGYSAVGGHQPTPVVLTRHVAAVTVQGNIHCFLADGPAAPGMSGGPVYAVKDDGDIVLVGIYAGLIHPGAGKVQFPEQATALSECFNLGMIWEGHWKPFGDPQLAEEARIPPVAGG